MTRSRTLATWIALAGGSLGLHRLYLYGARDRLAWLHPWPTLVGLYGVERMRVLGQDDRLAWVLIPLLGLMLVLGMLAAIVYGLTPEEKWRARFGAVGESASTGWATLIGVALALAIGGGVLMATIAFSAQRYFESEAG
jgi:hypothetical protein